MSLSAPRWNCQARERGLQYIVLVYEKADGFAFCPGNSEQPFRVGGDYDGNWPTSAEDGYAYFCQRIHDAYLERAGWFRPFAEKVAHGVDFSLDDLLMIPVPTRRLIYGKWPW